MSEPVRVKRIEVKGLFGLYDHTIDMKLQDRVTILHGPNGIGKTALLRMVKAALEADPRVLAEKPFERFRIECSTGSVLEATPAWGTRSDHTWPSPLVRFELVEKGKSKSVHVWSSSESPHRKGHDFQSLGKFVEMDYRPEWLVQMGGFIPVRLVDTHRLGVLSTATVDRIAADLAKRVSEALRSYANQVQEQGRTFPQRLLRARVEQVPIEELRSRLKRVEAELDRLNRLGLLETNPGGQTTSLSEAEISSADPAKLSFVVPYLIDQEAALRGFRGFAEKIELFERVIGSKFRDKEVRVVQKEGLVVRNRLGASIPLSSLSSGEQHEIVLSYALLFESPEGTLVLMDEPEISMHLLWQKQFVAEVVDIAALVKLDVVIATHSPYIVSERNDLMVPLAAGEP
jgi:ABC-type transport system involved in cytochrome c biogenesis ATPase subunit